MYSSLHVLQLPSHSSVLPVNSTQPPTTTTTTHHPTHPKDKKNTLTQLVMQSDFYHPSLNLCSFYCRSLTVKIKAKMFYSQAYQL